MKRCILLAFIGISTAYSQPPKKVLMLSEQYKERANWFLSMPQYNPDSSDYYVDRAIGVLDPSIESHRFQMLKLQYDRFRGNYLKLDNNGEDSLAKVKWPEYQQLEKSEKNRVLKYDFLVHWANVKLRKADMKASLELFKSGLKLIETKDSRATHAKVQLDKALFYGRYGLADERDLTIDYLHKSRAYFKSDPQKHAASLFMIYAELLWQHKEKNKDSAAHYLLQVDLLLKNYKKPIARAWYNVIYTQELMADSKHAEATRYINETLQILNRYNIQCEYKGQCYDLLGIINLKDKNYDQAIANYKNAYIEFQTQNDQYATLVLESIADAYEQKGDLKNALKYKDEFYDKSLALERDRNARSLREKELDVSLLTREKELEKKKNQQTASFVVFGIVALILLLLYRNFRNKQKSNLKLAVVNGQLEQKNQLLDKRNAENELLLKEIHHRVKNNLEIISGLLALQSAQIDDPNTKDAMIESQNRVHSIGIVHQKLYQGKNLGSIEMKDYFINLGEGILDTFNAESKVRIECIMDDLELDIDTAVPIGLIVNELLTNALKYAFPDNAKGEISISLQKVDTTLILKVSDNGIGKNVQNLPKGTGFGTQLIKLLTVQLNGVLDERSENGTHANFRFQLKAA